MDKVSLEGSSLVLSSLWSGDLIVQDASWIVALNAFHKNAVVYQIVRARNGGKREEGRAP